MKNERGSVFRLSRKLTFVCEFIWSLEEFSIIEVCRVIIMLAVQLSLTKIVECRRQKYIYVHFNIIGLNISNGNNLLNLTCNMSFLDHLRKVGGTF